MSDIDIKNEAPGALNQDFELTKKASENVHDNDQLLEMYSMIQKPSSNSVDKNENVGLNHDPTPKKNDLEEEKEQDKEFAEKDKQEK